jgi:sirohydrochlorin cobaltochelatase
MRPLVLIVGHGSRDDAANREFEHLVACYQARRPEFELRFGYVELARPSLAEALADLPASCRDVVILPLFLFAAGHVKNDIPRALATARERRPDVRFRTARDLGVHPEMVKLVLARGEEALPLDDVEAKRTVAVTVGRGSSHPDANGDFCKLTRLVGESRPFAWVFPSFISITRPRFEETLELAALARPEQLLIVPYLLFAGRLLNQLQQAVADFRRRYPQIKTVLAPQLGVHERLLKVLDERLDEARQR